MSESVGGLRILVAEDESLVAMDIEAMLRDLGCTVIGPVGRIEEALARAADAALDGAILDVNLRGAQVFPVAERLRARGVPFILSTGYNDASTFPESFRDAPRLTKPFDPKLLGRLIAEHFKR